MRLGWTPHVESGGNRAMTVAWYTVGGLVDVFSRRIEALVVT